MKPNPKFSIRLPAWLRWSSIGIGAALAIIYAINLVAAPSDYVIAQKPLYLAQSEPPLMMMVMSRDERLFTKAYSDYSDLDNDGILDTTYTDTFNYSGYFDSNLCYTYANSRFKAAAIADGDEGHTCSGSTHWSGNFLNWVTMSRLDILRYVLYGGRRVVDDLDQTVLERAHIPNDLHAWVKVYSGADIGNFTPGLSGTHSFCNSSHGNAANEPPVFRQAAGNYSEWAATALYQCRTGAETPNDYLGRSDVPPSATNFAVQVEVCDPTADEDLREEFCRSYSSGSDVHYKPTGLLQSYGESGRLRFGLISGSYDRPRSGGVLRRNIGRFSGNGAGCAAGNEINLSTGQLCNQGAGDEGIINTIDRFRLTQWNGWAADSKWGDCPDWGILNRQGFNRDRLNNPGSSGNGSHNCSAWGNPLAEMYAEALRYIAGETTRTTGFNGGSDLAGLPSPVWLDPYRSKAAGGNSYCANCNILVMSSSLPSFDSDEIPTIPHVGNVNTATNAVGTHQGVGSSLMVGRVGATPLGDSLNTHEDTCSIKAVGGLSDVRGVCPDIPSLEGSYLIAGMAHRARTVDMRPGLTGKPASYHRTVTTYGIALADNLPKFDIRVGDSTISLAPLCQANASGSAAITDSGWRTCHLGSVGVGPKQATVSPNHVYGRNLVYAPDGGLVAGSFSLVWEDSLWGNDHDNDVVSMLSFCVGAECGSLSDTPGNICWRSSSPACGGTVGSGEVLVRVETLSAYAGNGMLSGYAVTGSSADGVYRLARRPGGGSNDNSILTNAANPPGTWDPPQVLKFSAGSGGGGLLESPLWYAAKYGGFNDLNGNGVPDAGEWERSGTDQPNNYFFARDPSALRAELERIFETAANAGATTAGGGAGARIGDASFTLEAGYEVPDESVDWIGYLRAVRVSATGGRDQVLWNADIPAAGSRNIVTTLTPTLLDTDGTVDSAVTADDFDAANLGATNAAQLSALGVPMPIPGWLGGTPSATTLVDYLRGAPVAGYRIRSSVLGSIINSQPKVAGPLDDFGYADWRFLATTDPDWRTDLGEGYEAYLAAKATRVPMVYVGANDGMLHGFNASQTSASGGGDEEFAFIPATSRAHLYELANPNYEHKYFVDGAIAVADVSFSAIGQGQWHTVLVGSTGGGGASIPAGGSVMGHGSVFALDVSNPTGFDEDDVLWELSGANDADLGFVLGEPVIVPIAGAGGAPRWVAIFGNGPNSGNGRPVLYVIDIATGERLAKLHPTAASYAVRNGLMNIAPVSFANNTGLVDVVYGGDLQGNLWKFDLSDTDPTSWAIAYGGQPLFTAGIGAQVQPITAGIEVSSGPGGGISIFFGTGSYFAQNDAGSTTVQSFYGIWDNNLTRISAGRDALAQQTITAGVTSNGYETRDVTSNPVSYLSQRGWYIDLQVGVAETGERFIGMPRLQSGRVIFPTYQPTGTQVCSSGGGINWEYALDLLTGQGRMSGITLDPGGESVCVGDCGAIGLNRDSGGSGPASAPGAPVRSTDIFVPRLVPCDPSDPTCTVDDLIDAEQCTFVLRAPGADPLYLPRPCGRQSWRQVR